MIDSIAPDELAQVLADDTIPVQLIDVRERQEVEIAAQIGRASCRERV